MLHPQPWGLPASQEVSAMPSLTPEKAYSEQRRNRRAKVSKPMRVRPSEPRDDHFEDLPVSVNASRDGVFFQTRRTDYYKGMRVFVTLPFGSAQDPMNCEYIGQVVRIESLPNGKVGIAVHLKMMMNFDSSSLKK